MHELSLHGILRAAQHTQFLHQLKGITRMSPQHVEEVHCLFKARTPSGLGKIPSAGGSQAVQQDTQKIRTALASGIYFVKLVGKIAPVDTKTQKRKVAWTFEFKETPDAGKQSATTRLVQRTPIEAGDIIHFMSNLGFEFTSRFFVLGDCFYERSTTIFAYRVLQLPPFSSSRLMLGADFDELDLPPVYDTKLLDPSNAWLIEMSIEIVDGNNQGLKDQAFAQLNSLAQTLRGVVDMKVVDRLALDTRTSTTARPIT